ncbi:MAG: threonine/serine dehydratase [Balneolaceae bacterium]|nr:threonine/serine dehydratase [Balneolaceae bacterium]
MKATPALYEEIEAARKRIRDGILQTPLLHSPWLSELNGGTVYLKMESEQYTGSFKARGSLNKLIWLKEQGGGFFPVAASTGNHGLGVARALDLLGLNGRIYLPETAVDSKVEAIKAYGVEIEIWGDDPYRTELHAKELARKNEDWVYVSPYNDLQVVAGQGTVGAEILEQADPPDRILATVGGGGLISGIAGYLNERSPATRIVGCQPEQSPEMSVSVEAGEYREFESGPTLSDGSAGGFERDSITFAMCRQWVDEFILVTEEEIAEAIRQMVASQRKLIEGSAAVAVAAFAKAAERFRGQTVVIVICGGNISLETLRSVLND